MPFVKVIKDKAYFKRFQVKFARRRSGHTDYAARHKLITQDKNKYGSPKYRLVVRFSNKYVKVQVIQAEIIGDKCICEASSAELPRYGLKTGLKNFPAAYATGLLCARRLLTGLNLHELYTGNEEPDGSVNVFDRCGAQVESRLNAKKYYVEGYDEEAEKRKPFRAYLDIGIKTASRGAKVFAAMKGASDGGMDIPHNHKKFPGYDPDAKSYEPEEFKSRIMGGHIAEYMEMMEEDDEENYKKVFASYHDAEIGCDDLEGLYESVHANIREDPSRVKGLTFDSDGNQTAFTYKKTGKELKKQPKMTWDQRKAAANAKKIALREE
jgi:large subunit ribosomal protein L5e